MLLSNENEVAPKSGDLETDLWHLDHDVTTQTSLLSVSKIHCINFEFQCTLQSNFA